MAELAVSRLLWTTVLIFSVDAASEELAYAKFYQVVCEQIKKARESIGYGVFYPIPLEASYLYRNYMGSKGLLPQGYGGKAWLEPPSLNKIDDMERAEELGAYTCRIVIRQGVGFDKSTWEEATRWIWQIFEPPVRRDIRLVSIEEDKIVNWS